MPPPAGTFLREHLVDGAEGLHLEYPSNGFVGSDRKIAELLDQRLKEFPVPCSGCVPVRGFFADDGSRHRGGGRRRAARL